MRICYVEVHPVLKKHYKTQTPVEPLSLRLSRGQKMVEAGRLEYQAIRPGGLTYFRSRIPRKFLYLSFFSLIFFTFYGRKGHEGKTETALEPAKSG
jgi:hypothetical protein